MMSIEGKKKKSSLFDDIFKLQSAAPELDIDPEDPEDGFRSGLVEGVDEAESLGPSVLRKKAAIIPDDPKYEGKKTNRKALYSDDDEIQDGDISDAEADNAWANGSNATDGSSDNRSEEESMEEGMDDSGDEGGRDDDEEGEEESEENDDAEKDGEEGTVIMPPTASDDREKGKAVSHQLAVWDDIIKCRISMQKVVSSCNRLPTCDTWDSFSSNRDFHQLAANVHSSVRKVLSCVLDVQELLQAKNKVSTKSNTSKGATDSDEEITSESETEEKDEEQKGLRQGGADKIAGANEESDEEEDMSDEPEEKEAVTPISEKKRTGVKRKLDADNVEEVLAKHHMDFQTYRNDTLAKWDEKTRLSHAKIKSKNFAAFDLSVLKQIQQVLANQNRLIRRIHQNRSSHKILGQPEKDVEGRLADEVVEDEDDEIEMRQKAKQELPVDYEIIDDSDFYHICLRDLIELKQNEETDPILANKHWLEIQKLRNKHKRKVDTRASKGRKIRYNVKEKLKNYMTPYDKSHWSEEQREDLFKALFGGHQGQKEDQVNNESKEPLTIDIGL